MTRIPAYLLAIAALASAAPGPARTPPALLLHLRPEGDATKVARLNVTLTLRGIGVAAGQPIARLPLVVSNVDSAATAIADMRILDDAGPLTLTVRDASTPVVAARDAEAGGPSREWIADRATRGTVTIRYTVPADVVLPPRGAAPPLGFSADGAGTSAAGQVFLALPPGDARYRTTMEWDLGGLPAGARGLSSFGEGRVAPAEPLSANELRMGYYMAGRIASWPARVPAAGFFSAWQGDPPFDASRLMQWTGTLHGRYAALFGQRTPPPYGVFLRYNPINAGGGVGLHHSFVTTFGRAGGPGTDTDDIRMTLAHEMFHTFQPFIGDPAGLASSWFGEGLATYYQGALPLRFGMITPAAFLKSVNFTAGRYYTSAMARVPNDAVPKRFWADTRVRTLPYDRGMLYFATVDEAVRRASRGTRSLDQLMLAMLTLEKTGRTTSVADWEALLRREIGEDAVRQFRAVQAGSAIPLPGDGAFGPCFRRTTRPMRRYELGFDTAVLAEPKRIVRGLVAGSAAAAAGLRDGDEIVVPVPQDGIQGDQTAMLELRIRHGGEERTIRYLPRSELVQAYQWVRVAGVPNMRCAL